ncbi:uncharacterized protein C5orf34 homolog [Callorhinchus milii]|uniref:uncharacterized protein C5orf34 homolog n=1 Tax=Callorhinchus milii TaxID=7868 RepID=UPI001C3F7C40|nr:uncharacterized protein C5orf34 homolog [Callorhinchus milii]
MVLTQSPGMYERYVVTVVQWCRGVSEESRETSTGNIDEPQLGEHGNWSVLAELQKIQRFNFLLENSNCTKRDAPDPAQAPASPPGPPRGGADIGAVLRRTSQAIQDIEVLLRGKDRAGSPGS